MSVRAVVLDIGNVLIEWAPERLYDARLGPEGRRRLMAEVDLHAMNLEVDRGADLHDAVEALARRHPNWAREIRWWRDDWLHMASPEIAPSVRLLRALRARAVPVFALSNFGRATFSIAEAAYPFLSEFDRRFISGHMGLIKPQDAIYAALESQSGVHPQNLLFTDDRPENIAAAARRGWHTHLFDDPDAWAHCLVRHGLLSEKDIA